MYEALVIALACLLGCFCTGYYLVRVLKGEDIRDLASDNVCGLYFLLVVMALYAHRGNIRTALRRS